MELKRVIEILEKHQEWRRDQNVPPKTEMQSPIEIGTAIDYALIELKKLRLGDVSFSLRDKFATAAMNGELSSQGGIDGCVWANEIELSKRAYLVADAMIKARSNES